ncbi:hypothetical protein PYCCODRAFT_1426767 [Trametes coccinea BRFM310]|uniref:Uncharacterized protein n=1 Tax=Trametes coccinea (strain BRFM310) TaxID=1353009 RepID=A0A1Y2IG99_TRAC3|nr:hypothetical protein PYCCODRAFT_1426767 [Trametes coccinea BRFM310]
MPLSGEKANLLGWRRAESSNYGRQTRNSMRMATPARARPSSLGSEIRNDGAHKAVGLRGTPGRGRRMIARAERYTIINVDGCVARRSSSAEIAAKNARSKVSSPHHVESQELNLGRSQDGHTHPLLCALQSLSELRGGQLDEDNAPDRPVFAPRRRQRLDLTAHDLSTQHALEHSPTAARQVGEAPTGNRRWQAIRAHVGSLRTAARTSDHTWPIDPECARSFSASLTALRTMHQPIGCNEERQCWGASAHEDFGVAVTDGCIV